MKTIFAALSSLLFVVAGFVPALAAGQDVKGSKDHPMLTRMPGFHITDYKDKDLGSFFSICVTLPIPVSMFSTASGSSGLPFSSA